MSLVKKILDGEQQSALARLFSSAVLKELAQKGKSPLFSRLITESLEIKESDLSNPISTVFESAFKLIRKTDYRHEYAYKAAITKKLLLGRHSLNTASLVTEFRVENCRADIAIFNGTSTAYEIKSERDSLNRLECQLSSYKKFFSKVYVITGENHIPEVLSCTPTDVGVLLLTKRFGISTIREAEEDASRVNPEIIFDSIQLREAQEILIKLGITPPNIANTQMRSALRSIFSQLDPAEAHEKMVTTLRHSRNSLKLMDLLGNLPESLQAAVFTTSLKNKEKTTLLEAINTPIREALSWAR
ncbi:sce7726 family protein [Pseudomonas sp. WAC2]|uniref:sce7726 family protein n=1 Tax=Pseudomonas sp. WAC2 TaxID=3055057 RepID=UPI0025AF07B4|nr:sce7726 family protein [Pseudomonas sp. WAC2]MDN3236070.1 sce7726 family protein [Pseudomonas sp. WAC2]